MSNLPQNLVLSVTDAGQVVRYVCLTGDYYQLRCSEDGVFNVTAKFAIVPVSGSNNIRIRSCYDNRYWTRRTTANLSLYAWETEAVEGTLFTPEVGPGNAWVSLVHASSGLRVVVLPPSDNFPYDLSLSSTTSATRFNVINYATLVKIPRYVMFKSGNNKYLAERDQYGPCLRYDMDAPTEPIVAFETFVTNSGAIRVKSRASDKYWTRAPSGALPRWILPNYSGSDNSDPNTVFDLYVSEPVGNTRRGVALFCKGNDRFCYRIDYPEYTIRNGLAAHHIWNEYDHPHVDEACITVISLADPSKSQVSDTRFRRHWITNTTTRELPLSTPLVFDNETDQDAQQDIIIPKEVTSRPMKYTFTNSVTHGNGAAQFNSQIPYLTEKGQIENGEVISLGLRSWGQTYDYNSPNSATLSTAIKPVVDVPAKTRVTATLLTRTVTCEIPFRYRMSEEFTTGGTEAYNRFDGVFIGEYTYGYQVRIDKTEPLAPASHQVTDAAS